SAHLTAWLLGAGDEHRERAVALCAPLVERALQHPLAYGALLRLCATLAAPSRQVVAVVEHRQGALADAARRVEADVVAVVSPAQARGFADAGFSLFEGKDAADGVAYDCRDFVCRLPTVDPSALSV
ncbi:MAG: thioredoxin domain-containing protein, partial [Actinomycetota bacterium]|nr:thioredoxin domain-containing protein [Actinomycetota bacterium]